MNSLKRMMAVLAVVGAGFTASNANAEVSYNVGFASEYYYREYSRSRLAAAQALDYEQGGLYLGTWAADVGDGLEIDLYGGYGMKQTLVSARAWASRAITTQATSTTRTRKLTSV